MEVGEMKTPMKFEINLNSALEFRLSLTGNTVRLNYKRELVNDVQRNNRLSSECLAKLIKTQCVQNIEILNIKAGDTHRNHRVVSVKNRKLGGRGSGI
jgi:hypothetical protein